MNDIRERLERSGLLPGFERAREARDNGMMRQILKTAGVTPADIESVLWLHGDLGPAATPEEKRKRFWEAVLERLAIAVVSGLLLGGAFVYASSGLQSAARSGRSATSVLMSDYRSPQEAYYRPFALGFAIGAVGGLVLGQLLYDPTAKRR
jgi:hypothetical protein